jgi:hypothetical protein
MTTHPQAGDGIVDNLDRQWIVDGQATDSNTKEVIGITYTNHEGYRRMLHHNEYRRETFGEYLTRPTGFGRWTWGEFAFIQFWVVVGTIYGFMTIDDRGWVVFPLLLAIELVIVIYMHRNYTGRNR